MTVSTGLDRLAGSEDVQRLVRGRRVALVAHPASVTSELRHAKEVLEAAGAELVALFGPEHGYGGEAQDMAAVGEEAGALRVYSLYGDTFEQLSPTPTQLEGVDVVVVDLQDVGARYYTFVWTAALVMKAASALGIETLILDRPNPLGGEVLEGAPQRPGFRSFVGLYDVPNRHGMTIGELMRMVREEEGIDEQLLTIVPMTGWRRKMHFDDTGLPWVLPSPNMPTMDTAIVYPGGCLIEGTLLSEGRGQTRPFEIFGAPWVDGEALARDVDELPELRGAKLRPLRFQPTFQKHAGALCGGVQLHVVHRGIFRSYGAYLRIIAAVVARYPDAPRWRTEEYEYVTDIPAIDLLTGSAAFREAVDAGDDISPLLEEGVRGAERFREARKAWLLYR